MSLDMEFIFKERQLLIALPVIEATVEEEVRSQKPEVRNLLLYALSIICF
jgi:flagellar basal body-associated protein FliL